MADFDFFVGKDMFLSITRRNDPMNFLALEGVAFHLRLQRDHPLLQVPLGRATFSWSIPLLFRETLLLMLVNPMQWPWKDRWTWPHRMHLLRYPPWTIHNDVAIPGRNLILILENLSAKLGGWHGALYKNKKMFCFLRFNFSLSLRNTKVVISIVSHAFEFAKRPASIRTFSIL